jgi:hypothetical protein
MIHRILSPICDLTVAVMVMFLASSPVAGQQKAPAAKKKAEVAATSNWTAPRTPWGDPDLQGVYTYSTRTPFQRPAAAGFKSKYTEAELSQLQESQDAGVDAEGSKDVSTEKPRITYNYSVWFGNDNGRLTGRTSLVVDPEDGRLPPLTARGQKAHDDLVAEADARRIGQETIYNSWTDHPIFTRCVARPMPRGAFYQLYNYGINIIQMPGYVVLHYESMHDVRVIPLDGRPHLDSSVRQWNGDSRGHWEGNTLVIDWTNFTDEEFAGVPEGNAHITERLTKVDPNTIDDRVTLNDPTMWTKPWTFALPWRSDDPNYQHPSDLYEYACHEGNYRMMDDSLSGTRAVKQQSQAAK